MRRQLIGRIATVFAGMIAAALAGCVAHPPSLGDSPKLLCVSSVDAWSFNGREGWKINTPHYTIYTTVGDEPMRRMLPQVMEGAYVQYRELVPDIEVSDKPMECYVFYERGEWAEFTKANMSKTDADVYLQIRRGGYTAGDRYVSWFIGLNGTSSVAAHEGFHQFIARNFKGRLPPYLEEGIATTFESVNVEGPSPRWNLKINPLRATALRHAVDDKDKLWPTAQLIRMHAGQVVHQTGDRIEAFYAQCWCFAKFMREADNGRYAPALQAWLTDTANGTVFDPTHSHERGRLPWNPAGVRPMLEHYTQLSLPEIDTAFQAYMRHVAYHEFDDQWQQ